MGWGPYLASGFEIAAIALAGMFFLAVIVFGVMALLSRGEN